MAQLRALEYPESLARAILENESSRRAEVEREPESRDLTRANLKSFYTLGIINEAIWWEEMRRLDYPENYITWFFQEMTAAV